jgi:hypothetical protein
MSNPERKWCYSRDEERFEGQYDTEDEAKAAAEEDLDNDLEVGDLATYWIAQVRSPEEFLNADTIGQNIQENLDEWLTDDIGWEDPIVELPPGKSEELGKLVLKFIRENNGFHAYGITKPVSHGYVKETE